MPDFTEVPIRTGPAPMGDNRPPGDEQTIEALGAKLKAENEDLALRVIEFENKLVKVPTVIDGKETAEKIADFVAIVRAAGKEASDRRETAKRPWLVGGKIVDGFFSALEGRIGRVKQALLNRADAYQARLRDEERLRQQAEMDRQRLEAEERRKMADAAAQAGKMDAALAHAEEAQQAEQRAEAAQAAVAAPPKEATRIGGAYGGGITSRTTWDFTVDDIGEVPPEYLLPNAAAIRAFMHAQLKMKREPVLAGIKFVKKTAAV